MATNNDGREDNNIELTKEVVENSMVVQYQHVRRKLQENQTPQPGFTGTGTGVTSKFYRVNKVEKAP